MGVRQAFLVTFELSGACLGRFWWILWGHYVRPAQNLVCGQYIGPNPSTKAYGHTMIVNGTLRYRDYVGLRLRW